MFNGRMGCSYFFGPEQFFEHFDFRKIPNQSSSNIHYCGKVESISFYLHGMLEGEYKLRKNPELVIKGIDVDDCFEMRNFSPVYFKIQISDHYDKILHSCFKKINEDYKERIIEPSELSLWKTK